MFTRIEKIFKSNLMNCCGRTTWIILAVIGFYYTIVILLSRNFPISDDFALVNFVNNVALSPKLVENLKLLYAQHNEHRIITTKLIFLIDYWLFGVINFKRLIMIGNIFHLGTFYIVVKNVPKNINQKCYFVVFAACMIFQFGSAESMLWSMAAISNYLVLLLSFMTLNFLSKVGLHYFILAVITSLLAVFTQGNGILILFITIAYLVSQKRYRDSLSVTIIMIIVLCVYFFKYQVPANHSDPFNAIRNLGGALIFAVSFSGSAFGIGGSHYPAMTTLSLIFTLALGVIIWGSTGYGFYKKSYLDGNIFIWFNLFVILTAIVTAISRINFGFSQSMVSRYHIYSNLAIISTTVLILQLLPINQYSAQILDRFFKILVISSFVYLVATLVFVFYFYYFVYSQIRSGGIIFPDINTAKMILGNAKDIGVFIP